MRTRIRQVEVQVFRERDGSHAAACSALGVYTVGKTLAAAKANFLKALDLHFGAILNA
ncbi:MAG: hypothetical protein NTY90_00390 [Candidatus Micrarchaeota archaeon]|nr:hypothetical protein [Candidatus Micrarchaeota archaeon]